MIKLTPKASWRAVSYTHLVLPEMLHGVRLLKGIELNILDFDGTIDMDEAVLQRLDLAIASLHMPCIKPGTKKENTPVSYTHLEDMLNGYYIYNPSDEKLTFTLNDETRYDFYDTGALFISEDNETRMYTTQEVSELLKKFDAGNGELGETPFEIQVLEDGRVISIREIFIN